MIAVKDSAISEVREKMTKATLQLLQLLPERQRDIFIWNHYRGYRPQQIAEVFRCGIDEVEAALEAITALLYERTRTLLREDWHASESDLHEMDSQWTALSDIPGEGVDSPVCCSTYCWR